MQSRLSASILGYPDAKNENATAGAAAWEGLSVTLLGTPQLAAREVVRGPGPTDDDFAALELASRRSTAILVFLHCAGVDQVGNVDQQPTGISFATYFFLQWIQKFVDLDGDGAGFTLALPLA